jgi:hypothetical protein
MSPLGVAEYASPLRTQKLGETHAFPVREDPFLLSRIDAWLLTLSGDIAFQKDEIAEYQTRPLA